MLGQQVRPQRRIALDLATPRAATELVERGFPMQQIFVAQLTAGADFQLRFGGGNPPVPMLQGGGGVHIAPLVEGLYCDNPAQPGMTAVIIVTQGQL